MTDEMPIATTHKGVGIHAGQPAKRVALVKKEIDKVARISDLMRLYEIAGDVSWSPEARVFAGARCRAGLEIAIERREARPAIGVEAIECRIAGCGSRTWQSPTHYCSLLDAHDENAVPREQPLDDPE